MDLMQAARSYIPIGFYDLNHCYVDWLLFTNRKNDNPNFQ